MAEGLSPVQEMKLPVQVNVRNPFDDGKPPQVLQGTPALDLLAEITARQTDVTNQSTSPRLAHPELGGCEPALELGQTPLSHWTGTGYAPWDPLTYTAGLRNNKQIPWDTYHASYPTYPREGGYHPGTSYEDWPRAFTTPTSSGYATPWRSHPCEDNRMRSTAIWRPYLDTRGDTNRELGGDRGTKASTPMQGIEQVIDCLAGSQPPPTPLDPDVTEVFAIRLSHFAKAPTVEAGNTIYLYSSQTVKIEPFHGREVKTDISFVLPEGVHGQIKAHSQSAAKYRVDVHSIQISAFNQESIMVYMFNCGSDTYFMDRGDLLAEMTLTRNLIPKVSVSTRLRKAKSKPFSTSKKAPELEQVGLKLDPPVLT